MIFSGGNEHSRLEVSESYGWEGPSKKGEPVSTHRPFADLGDLLQDRKSS
jgi:hypothetical protein